MRDTIVEILEDIGEDVDFDTCETLIDDGITALSVDIIQLIGALNDEFDISIPATEISCGKLQQCGRDGRDGRASVRGVIQMKQEGQLVSSTAVAPATAGIVRATRRLRRAGSAREPHPPFRTGVRCDAVRCPAGRCWS